MTPPHDCPYSDLIPRLDESVKGIRTNIEDIKAEQTAFLAKIDKIIELKTDKSYSSWAVGSFITVGTIIVLSLAGLYSMFFDLRSTTQAETNQNKLDITAMKAEITSIPTKVMEQMDSKYNFK